MRHSISPGRLAGDGVTYAIPLLAALISVTPFIFMLGISFQSVHFVSGNPARWIPQHPTVSTYQQVLETANFVRWIANSLLVASTVTLIALLIQSMAGYVFAKKQFPGKNVLFIVILGGGLAYAWKKGVLQWR